tara:strand:+ start:941 stop:1660 length:720 start_codon:yes stop_codon:yes gene_type:complete
MDLFAIAGFGTNIMFSLGIIFVVIFVVFYIRGRLTNFDHKLNSMFELINAMADEINDIKASKADQSNGMENPPSKWINQNSSNNGLDLTMNPINPLLNPINSHLLEVSDDESDEDSDDESDDESGEDSDDESENNEDRILEIHDVENDNLVFDEITKENLPSEKTIILEDNEISKDNSESIDNEDESDNKEETKLIDNLQLNDYNKMTVKELRSYIKSNNLYSGDISKMKKSELIELCE